MRVPAPDEALGFTLAAIRLASAALAPRGIPLIGFSGAPFTLACYALEGGSSTTLTLAKQLMLSEPAIWHRLMAKLSQVAGQFLLAQARAGA
jgi:uroporphyrinogen decarboxylase